jgi:hypothetical protein
VTSHLAVSGKQLESGRICTGSGRYGFQHSILF